MATQRVNTELFNTKTFSDVLLYTQAEAGTGGGGTGGGSVLPDAPTIRIGLDAGVENQGYEGVAIGHNTAEQNQGAASVAVGASAGQYNQGTSSVSIGYFAGFQSQKVSCISVGTLAGQMNQSNLGIAMGSFAGTQGQGVSSIAMGTYAGNQGQGQLSIAIGFFAGSDEQDTQAISIGREAGRVRQGADSIAMGWTSGFQGQGQQSVGIGAGAGLRNQGDLGIAIGSNAGAFEQGALAIGMGTFAGYQSQGSFAISAGYNAGYQGQGSSCVAIGREAGLDSQGQASVSVGMEAGKHRQGINSVAIGRTAGFIDQGSQCVAIGHRAGWDGQADGSVCLNAGPAPLTPATEGFFVKPVRIVSNSEQEGAFIPVLYNPETGEVVQSGIESTKSTVLRMGYVSGADPVAGAPNGNRGITLGAEAPVPSTAFIDFNSLQNGTNDFDARIISIGGQENVVAQAILQFQAAEYIFSGITSDLIIDNRMRWRSAGTTILPGGSLAGPLKREFGSSMTTFALNVPATTTPLTLAMDFRYPDGTPMYGHYWFSMNQRNDGNPGAYSYRTWELYLYRTGTNTCRWEEVYPRRGGGTDINITTPSETAPNVNIFNQVNRPAKFFAQVTLIDF